MTDVCAVVGGQFGSEGKGAIVAHIAKEYDVHVRVGAANAGHTLYTKKDLYEIHVQDWGDRSKDIPLENPWEKHVMQQLPCAAYANPTATLMLGPGAQISSGILDAELVRLARWRVARGLTELPRIIVDPHAHVITGDHIEREQASGLDKRIGSTSTVAKEGIGAAQAARVMREESCVTARMLLGGIVPEDSGLLIRDVPVVLHESTNGILLEGTQGAGLSLTTGSFPYVTSRNTTVAGLCADAGVSPRRVDRVILVIRTFPIRVAGNSGPFHEGSFEISWSDIGVDPETERTTVTKKIRRVASFSMPQVVEACYLNGATEIALMFCDYFAPQIYGRTHARTPFGGHGMLTDFITSVEVATQTPVRYLGTGPHSIIDRGASR